MLEHSEILRKVFQAVSEMQLDINEITKLEKSFLARECDEPEEMLQNVNVLLKSISGKVTDINKYVCTTKDSNHNMQASFVNENGIGEEKEDEVVDELSNGSRCSVDKDVGSPKNDGEVPELAEDTKQIENNAELHVAKIKLKDISTLLDPSFLQKKNKMDDQEDTVLVISDSDDEEPKKNKNKKERSDLDDEKPRRKTRFAGLPPKKSNLFRELREKMCKKKMKKTVDSDSDSEEFRASKRSTRTSKKTKKQESSSDSEKESKRKTRRKSNKKYESDSSDSSDQRSKSKKRNNLKRNIKELLEDDLVLKTSSSANSESDSSATEGEDTKKTKSSKQKQIKASTKDERCLGNVDDEKFSWKCYVDLIRYTPENLKKLYKEKTEAKIIEK